MRENNARAVLGLACIVAAAGLLMMGAPEQAEAVSPGSVQTTVPNGVICPPVNLAARAIQCGNGYGSILAETESATAVYFCGSNARDGGVTSAMAATSCAKRCTGCANGTQYTVDVISNPPQVYCWSAGTSDAGVVVAVSCVR